MISIHAWSDPKQHIRIIFRLDPRKLLVVLAPEGSLPILLERVSFVGVCAHIWCDGTECINADFAGVLVPNGVDIGFAPGWQDRGCLTSVCQNLDLPRGRLTIVIRLVSLVTGDQMSLHNSGRATNGERRGSFEDGGQVRMSKVLSSK